MQADKLKHQGEPPTPAPAICPECGEWAYQCVCGDDGGSEGQR